MPSDMPIEARTARAERMVFGLKFLASTMSCDPIDEKPFSGLTTKEGDLCRLSAYAAYLLAVLLCDFSPNESCCDDAEKDYCTAWEACPA